MHDEFSVNCYKIIFMLYMFYNYNIMYMGIVHSVLFFNLLVLITYMGKISGSAIYRSNTRVQ